MTDSMPRIRANQGSAASRSTRLAFIDNLRIFLTVLVVAHHAAQSYGPTGGRWLIFNAERAEILGAFFSTNAAFFMGLFFLIAGYFLPDAYDRKGAVRFLKDRFLRLGIPILFFALVVFPLMLYAAGDRRVSLSHYLAQTSLHPNQLEFGHLWFLAHLLVYAVGYWVWREWIARKTVHSASQVQFPVLSDRAIAIYLTGLAIVTFMVRIQYPIDTWVRAFGIIPVEVAHLPQYLSLMVLGIFAYRYGWVQKMPNRQGIIWLWVGFGAVLLRYLYGLAESRLFPTPILAGGGWSWQSALWSGWEAVICVGLCVGLLVLFRDSVNQAGKWQKFLADSSYAVYLIHLPIVIGIQFCFATVAMTPLAKFFGVTLMSLPICWRISCFLRQLPFIKKIL